MKKAKRGKIIFKEVKSTYCEYTCPHCKVTIVEVGIRKTVTRFLCDKCNNEIIVDNSNLIKN